MSHVHYLLDYIIREIDRSNRNKYTIDWFAGLPVWERMWMTSWPDWMKVFPQSLHWCGRSPVWMRMCRCSLPLCSKPRPQCGQRYGFSLVWIRRWTLRFSLTENDFPQTSHTNGLSPTHATSHTKIEHTIFKQSRTYWHTCIISKSTISPEIYVANAINSNQMNNW